MHKNYVTIAAVSGALAVALGAFGAHSLQSLTTDEKILHGYQTGVQYQFYHSFALLFVAISFPYLNKLWLKWSVGLFVAGIILFSGSLYLLTFLKLENSTFTRYIGPVTPLGGLCFILGWLFLAASVSRSGSSGSH